MASPMTSRMTSPTGSQFRTRNFARVLGPFFTVVAVIAAARGSAMASILAQFTAGEVWSWVVGAFVLAGGIAIVAFHQYWRTPAAAIVSVIGWLLVVRGVLLMAFPTVFASVAQRLTASIDSWQWLYIAMALVGLYLTYVGWMPLAWLDANRTDDTTGGHDMPHAA